jgi:hypothetical protein
MSPNTKPPGRERRRRPPPLVLPDDLYDYAEDRHSGSGPPLGSHEGGTGIGHVAIIDDWPDDVPVTEAEVDIFERYFGDVLDRLFGESRS